jgi:hypothetical protein
MQMNLQTLLQDSSSLRRMVVLVVLIAILLFHWQPAPGLRAAPVPRREDDRPLPPGRSGAGLRGERPARPAHRVGSARPLPGVRQAARRRPGRRG